MKKILIPVDFSENSRNAVEYTLSIFGQQSEKIQLTFLNAYKVYSSTGMFISVEKYMQKDAEEDMRMLMSYLEDKKPENIELEGKVVRGDVIPTLCHIAEEEDYDLIVMGTKGASGLKEVFLGSVASGVIKQAKNPVLVVPGDFEYKAPHKILFAVDGNAVTGAAVTQVLNDIAATFDSEILILHIIEKDEEETNTSVDPATDLFIQKGHSTYMQFPSDDINASINSSIHAQQADMLCMIRRNRSALEKLFHTSTTAKEVFDCPVPFLVLQD
jgi:nucleotide-binding universal stress UspA family protein